MKTIAAAAFKATCLKIIDRIAETGESFEITKRGKALVRLVPVAPTPGRGRQSIFGAAKGTILYLAPDEDLLSTGTVWDADR